MDAFEESMELLSRMSESDRNILDEQNREKCLCPTCPTYADCAAAAKEIMFCLTKKSSCIIASKGCHCPGCPVKAELGMTNIYFCLNGAEIDIRKNG
jgi:hypothetical protein